MESPRGLGREVRRSRCTGLLVTVVVMKNKWNYPGLVVLLAVAPLVADLIDVGKARNGPESHEEEKREHLGRWTE